MSQKTINKTLTLLLLGLTGLLIIGLAYAQVRPGAPTPIAPLRPVESTTSMATSTKAEPPAAASRQDVGISVGDDFTGLTDEQLGGRLDRIASLGITWLRFDADWSYTQRREGGSFNWNTLDRIVSMASARHLKLLPILDFTPSWARSSHCNGNRCMPRDNQEFAAFAAFAAAAAQRYAPQGVHTWEVWNEPNIMQFWQPAPSSAAYTELLKAAYIAIKKVDPEATVVSGGLASTDSGGGNINPLDFLKQIYAQGGGAYFDAVGFHPYSYPLLPSNGAKRNAWQQMSATSPSLRSIMTANGDSQKKIWMTEFGAPTGGPDSVDEAAQSAMLTDALKLAGTYNWAGPLFVYTYIDQGTSADTKENFFGLLRYDGSQKPAYQALKQAIATMTFTGAILNQ